MITFLNSEQYDDALFTVFSFLSYQELIKYERVSKRFKKIADNPLLYPPAVFEIKTAAENMFAAKRQNEYCYKVMTDQERLLEDKKQALEKMTSCMGTVAKHLGTFPIVNAIAIALFPPIQKKQVAQASLTEEIKQIESQPLAEEYTKSLEKYQKATTLYEKSKFPFQNFYGLDKIHDLFGGKTAFEKLPVLDIGQRGSDRDYIDFLKPEDMTAPIMRGIDSAERIFVAIRAKSRSAEARVQTIFQRYSKNTSYWSDGNANGYIISIGGYIINPGRIIDKSAYNNFQTLIGTKKFKGWTLE